MIPFQPTLVIDNYITVVYFQLLQTFLGILIKYDNKMNRYPINIIIYLQHIVPHLLNMFLYLHYIKTNFLEYFLIYFRHNSMFKEKSESNAAEFSFVHDTCKLKQVSL